MPMGARLFHIAVQDAVICIWVSVKPDEPPVQRTFQIVATGQEDEEAWRKNKTQS